MKTPQILFEDDLLLALHKPSGWGTTLGEAQSVVDWLTKNRPELGTWDSRGERGLLHRLDVGTSGVLLIAKTEGEWNRLREIWKTEQVTKIYRALVSDSLVAKPPFDICVPIGHSAKSAKKMIAVSDDHLLDHIRGKPLTAESRVHATRAAGDSTDVIIEIFTGVRHQIRVHLATIGSPIVGDEKYGGIPSSRIWLHAWKLIIPLASGARLELRAALPNDWVSGDR